MKDETARVPVVEFVGLRRKMYSYIKDDGNGGKTTRGIKKYVIKGNVTHENYRNTLTKKPKCITR